MESYKRNKRSEIISDRLISHFENRSLKFVGNINVPPLLCNGVITPSYLL